MKNLDKKEISWNLVIFLNLFRIKIEIILHIVLIEFGIS